MFESIEHTDQDDVFDFLRIDADQLAAGFDWINKSPSEMKPGLSTDVIVDSLEGIGLGNKKGRDTFS